MHGMASSSIPWTRAAAGAPSPAVVRSAAAGAAVLGAGMTLPGIVFTLWSASMNLEIGLAGQGALALGAGILVGYAVLARWLRERDLARFSFMLSGFCASLSLAALSAVYSPQFVLPSAVGMGMGIGLLLGALPPLFAHVMARAETAAGLLGLAWAWGALAVSFFAWMFLRALTLSSMMLGLAALMSAGVLLTRWTPAPRPHSSSFAAAGWKSFLTPEGALLALVVGFFGGAHGAAASLLSLFVSGKLGSGLHFVFAVPIIYWLSLVTALLTARRVAALEERPSRMVLALCGSSLGCVFLLRATEPSGIVAGTVVLGAGTGVLLTLLCSWVGRQVVPRRESFPGPLLILFSAAGVASVWAASLLTAVLGIEAIVWTVGALIFLGAVGLSALLIETRFLET